MYTILSKPYNSPRISREFLDCSMPFTFDQYGNCGYGCLYCFSTFQRGIGCGKEDYYAKNVKKVSIKNIKRIFTELDSSKNRFAPFIKNRITMQWGGLSDPFCPIEEQDGLGYEILSFLKEIKYPICFSSKSDLILRDKKYLDLFKGMEKYWSYKASIITLDEKKSAIIETGAPSPQKRIETLRALSDIGIWTIWRLRPFIIGLSDLDYEKQIYTAGKIGCKAISTEFFCLELRAEGVAQKQYKILSDLIKFNIVQFYKNISTTNGYLRLNRKIKMPYFLRMKEICREFNMNFHVSDAHGKELGDSGSCCGLPSKDNGDCALTNYSKCQFTNALQIAKRKGFVCWDDISNDDIWLKTFKTDLIYNTSSMEKYKKCKMSTYQFMLNEWNNPKSQNSPYKYFHGILIPDKLDKNENIIYKYNENSNSNIQKSRNS